MKISALHTMLFLLFLSSSAFSQNSWSQPNESCCDEAGSLSFAIQGILRNFSGETPLSGMLTVKLVDPEDRSIVLGTTSFGPIANRESQTINFPNKLHKESCHGRYIVVFEIALTPGSGANFNYFGDIIVTNHCDHTTIDLPFDHYTSGNSTLLKYQFESGYFFGCEGSHQ